MKKIGSAQPTAVESQIVSVLWHHGPIPVRTNHDQLCEWVDTNDSTTVTMQSVKLEKERVTRDDVGTRMIRELTDKVYLVAAMSLVLRALLARVLRFAGSPAADVAAKPPASAARFRRSCWAFVCALSIGGSVAMPQEHQAGAADPDSAEATDGFGPESNGIRVRLVAVSQDSDDENPDPTQAAGEYARDDQMTFTVELKNVSSRPITLLGVRYGENYPTAKGRLHSAFFGPHLFEFDFTDASGNPVPRASRNYASDTFVLDGTSTHDLEPGQSLSIVLRPGRFTAPMNYDLPDGHFQARVRYRGPSDGLIDRVKTHWPDKPHVKAWKGEATSNSVQFAIAADPKAKKRTPLNWGPTVDGLQAAVEFRVPDHVLGVPSDLPGIPLNAATSVLFHVRNVSDQPITFASETGRQGDTIHVTDANGEKVDVRGAWFSGWPIDVRWVLDPGDVAVLSVLTPGVGSISQPGMYTVHYTIRFNSRQQKDKDGNVVFPKPTDYQSELDTGDALLFYRERTPEDDARAKPPSFTSRIAFVDESGKPIESGRFTYRGQLKHKDHIEREVTPGPSEIPDCTATPATILVRAPGYEEAVFHNLKFKPNETIEVKLKRASTTHFRLVSSADGTPVAGAKIRYFNATSAKASSGPYPTKGIQGQVWTHSDDAGRVVLDSLQRINPIYEKLGDVLYFFYIEPATLDFAPRFVGPMKAGQQLGDISLGSLLEIRGEVQGTADELGRFSAEWDQPVELTSENPDATWTYAVSKRLKTKREGNKLTFHLQGLRPGKLRIISNFGPRPHSVSHTYTRRDPKGSDRVVQLDLDKPYIGLLLNSQTGQRADQPKSDESKTEQPAADGEPAESVGMFKADLFEPFQCKIIDAVTGQPIKGKAATIHFRFRKKTDDGEDGETIDNLIWTKAESKFDFLVADRTMKHPDRDKLVVQFGIRHPQYEVVTGTVSLKEILQDQPKSARDKLRVIRMQPRKVDLKEALDKTVSLEVSDELLFAVLSDIESQYHVPLTISLERLHAMDISAGTRVSIKANGEPLRDVIERLMLATGATAEFTDDGVLIPGNATRIRVRYEIPDAEKETRIFVQHIGGRGEIGTVEEALSKWSPLKNGETLELKDLDEGDYQVARLRRVDAAQAGRGRMMQEMFLDRRRFTLKPGQSKTINFSRARAGKVTGILVGFAESKVDTGMISICSDNAADENADGNLDVVIFDALNCKADGSFETEPLSPGNYVALASVYLPLTPEQLATTGRPVPAFTGRQAFTVPAIGDTPNVAIRLNKRE